MSNRYRPGFVSKPVTGEWPELTKRPVAWRVKAFADGLIDDGKLLSADGINTWILFDDEAAANRHAEDTGALMQGLYVRDGTAPQTQESGMSNRYRPFGSFDYSIDLLGFIALIGIGVTIGAIIVALWQGSLWLLL
jgi:hypothetical protein